jgi:hypothetical protein
MAYLLSTNVNLLSPSIAGPHTRQLLSEQCVLLCNVILLFLKGDFFDFFFEFTLSLLHLSPLRFHCVGGCWDRHQDCCDFGIDSQTV